MEEKNDLVSFLEHHGVKGQKWGVRNSRRNPGTKGPILPSGRRARKFDTNQLNNKELKKVIDRMNMEKQYAELNAKTKTEGRVFTKQLFTGIVTAGVSAAGAALAKHFINQMMNKAPGPKK